MSISFNEFFYETLQTLANLRRRQSWVQPLRASGSVAIQAAHWERKAHVFLGTEEHNKAYLSKKQTPKRTRVEIITSADSEQDKNSLVEQAREKAAQYVQSSRRVAIVVNHVQTAIAIAAELRKSLRSPADVVLLTDRLRPYERDRLIAHWAPFLRGSAPERPKRPVVIVTTQASQVGAHFSFDVLIIECADSDTGDPATQPNWHAEQHDDRYSADCGAYRQTTYHDGDGEVLVIWRCDLPDDTSLWAEIISLCPPTSGEALPVSLRRLRAWLRQDEKPGRHGDAQGTGEEEQNGDYTVRPALIWRGKRQSRIARTQSDIMPRDIVIVPAAYGMAPLSQSEPFEAIGTQRLDLWEPAQTAVGRSPAVRLTRSALAPWMNCPPVAALVRAAESPDWSRQAIDEAIEALKAYRPRCPDDPTPPPDWWLRLLDQARGWRITAHPSGGLVLFGRPAYQQRGAAAS